MLGLGTTELLVLLVLGVLLFGRKLPDIGRSLGKTVVEFKSAMSGMEDEIKNPAITRVEQPDPVRPPQRVTTTAPMFTDDPVAPPIPPKV